MKKRPMRKTSGATQARAKGIRHWRVKLLEAFVPTDTRAHL